LRGTIPLRHAARLNRTQARLLRDHFLSHYKRFSGVDFDECSLVRFEMAIFAAKARLSGVGRLRALAMAVYLFGRRDGSICMRGFDAKE
jgi:hypothetical protein